MKYNHCISHMHMYHPRFNTFTGHLNHDSTLLTGKLYSAAPIPTNPQNPSCYVRIHDPNIKHTKTTNKQQISAHISWLHVGYRKRRTVLATHSTSQTLCNSTILVNRKKTSSLSFDSLEPLQQKCHQTKQIPK